MEISKIKSHIVKPKGLAIALVSQYGIMPLAAFCFAKVLQLGPIESLAVLIYGCCPGGNMSNVFALAAQGDMNLSIVMTTCSTLLALGMMPLTLYLYCHGIPNIESMVPFTGIIVALIMTLLPCAIGIAINHWVPQHSPKIIKAGMSLSLIGVLVFSVLSAMTFGKTTLMIVTPLLLTTTILLPLSGFLFGYILSAIFRLRPECCRTVAIETCCQNIQVCSTILKVAFAPEVIGPLFLVPYVFVTFQIMEVSLFIISFRCYQRFQAKAKKNLEYQTVDSKAEEMKKNTELQI
ncbi:hypothetical protein JZ751_004862 [Albula glossodonta]|uniref:Solute carrier family 10 member 1 n=1 Tax=Albula glossodonta TaxID=121402 RepID=A0A8T2P401_9TELE|nr:hypothetical protein JZ751_004862 [Albula glossodonta]